MTKRQACLTITGMTNQTALRILADYIGDEQFREFDGEPPLPPRLLWGLLNSYWEHFITDGTGLKPILLPDSPRSGVTALEALMAGTVFMQQWQGARWWMAAEARKDGHSWREIGDALGMTKQAAWEGFRKYADEHESYAPSFRRLNDEYRSLAGDSCDE